MTEEKQIVTVNKLKLISIILGLIIGGYYNNNFKMKRCKVCKKALREENKHEVCSNCGSMHLSSVIKKGLVKL